MGNSPVQKILGWVPNNQEIPFGRYPDPCSPTGPSHGRPEPLRRCRLSLLDSAWARRQGSAVDQFRSGYFVRQLRRPGQQWQLFPGLGQGVQVLSPTFCPLAALCQRKPIFKQVLVPQEFVSFPASRCNEPSPSDNKASRAPKYSTKQRLPNLPNLRQNSARPHLFPIAFRQLIIFNPTVSMPSFKLACRLSSMRF